MSEQPSPLGEGTDVSAADLDVTGEQPEPVETTDPDAYAQDEAGDSTLGGGGGTDHTAGGAG